MLLRGRLFCFAAFILGSEAFCWVVGLRVNLTASMPIGVYQRQSRKNILPGDLISCCLPTRIAVAGRLHDYLGYGVCSGNTTPLLKEVIALPGDRVVLSSQFIKVNGKTYFAPQQPFDHKHQPIRHWVKNGIYKQVKSVWVYGSHDPMHSWDSRYFGGIPMKNIQGVYEALLASH